MKVSFSNGYSLNGYRTWNDFLEESENYRSNDVRIKYLGKTSRINGELIRELLDDYNSDDSVIKSRFNGMCNPKESKYCLIYN